ncbi:H+transporting two-sector ATPase alpha/beta subunit central region [Alkalidesulfovibrio alkalitolerans DSM 16529]|uniref:V-type ATP synthase alpha chain n=1 Tax=Alkalidesulfovibrio alkalitolerans DSM 16529 TaxID=1121439 RepID=S7UQ59_9BACT|nr:V-type ATP synthase subunit A [Alkalidesulfovibrio alkalitolerans]EPR36184.1 H+transporting two-sector ATPase alpha/beta subunit central region [Alkalidesulfovibrio alkalitolerans DSM 16529]
MSENVGRVMGVNGNLLTVEFSHPVFQNEMAYAEVGEERLKAEVIRVRGRYADLQVFEDTKGLRIGDRVHFSGELLSVQLGPGLLTRVYDGLQNPLAELAEQSGFFLKRGLYLDALDMKREWDFTPSVKEGDEVAAGHFLGHVPEGIFEHRIMVPFGLAGQWTVKEIAPEGAYNVTERIALLTDAKGNEREVTMMQHWPVKIPIKAYVERLRPKKPLVTKVRIIDTICPVAVGGVYCTPGPFGAGKTVLQQITSRHADVDVVVICACGERAGEVVETIREFPKLTDPRTGKSLMERTCIICNTSSMPVAAREASVYTAVTIAEYYRQMGLNVLLLADSTSRWAQALREMSGRLEEIPGEEAFPAYLESVIASFYERGGIVRLHNGSTGSVTIGGTVSPAGGNFEEPVTQATLKVVGAFHGLSRVRSDARRYPAVDPLDSWSKYDPVVPREQVALAERLLRQSAEVAQMMKVVGEEGTSMEDFVIHLKGEYLDAVYLQQDAFDEVDGATSADRQRHVFARLHDILETEMDFSDKNEARAFFQRLIQATRDWNRAAMDTDEFAELESKVRGMVSEAARYA